MSAKEKSGIPVLEASLIGLISGFAAVLLSFGVSWLGTVRLHLSHLFGSSVILPIFGLLGGLFAGALVELVAPEASGSGIPQVRACLSRVVLPLDLRVALVKLVGGTLSLGAGFFMGREGPTVQLGAALAVPISKCFHTASRFKRKLIAAGAGAGLTAAFNAPLAGIVFVFEELLQEIDQSSILITLISSGIACLVLNMFSPPHIRSVISEMKPQMIVTTSDAWFYLLLAVLAGISGAAFNNGILASMKLSRFLKLSVTFKVAMAGLLSGAALSLFPESFCNFAGMRAHIVAGETDWHLVAVALVVYWILTMVAYGSGAPGGLFAPSLTFGSCLGSLIGFMEQSIVGSGSSTAFALVGMGAFFSAVARTPLTAIVITFELTTSFDLLVPLILCCLISSMIADALFEGGLYDHLMNLSGIGLNSGRCLAASSGLRVHDVMVADASTFSSNTPVNTILTAFNSVGQRSFVVVDGAELVGVITQTDLAKISDAMALEKLIVADIMTPHPVAVNADERLEDVMLLFGKYKFTWMPVINRDRLCGVIYKSAVLEKLYGLGAESFENAAEDSSDDLGREPESSESPVLSQSVE